MASSDANTTRAENFECTGGSIKDSHLNVVRGSSIGSSVGFGTVSHGLNGIPVFVIVDQGTATDVNEYHTTLHGFGPMKFVAMGE